MWSIILVLFFKIINIFKVKVTIENNLWHRTLKIRKTEYETENKKIRDSSSSQLLVYMTFTSQCTSVLIHVQLFVTLWASAHQAPVCMEFSRQGYWRGLLCPSPGNLPDPRIEPVSRSGSQIPYHLSHLRSPFTSQNMWNEYSTQFITR